MSELITRKDIAQLLGKHVSVWMVAKNEKRWGLDRARVKLQTRSVLYHHAKVISILRAVGMN